MPRTLVKTRQIEDLEITSANLAPASIITEKIKDGCVINDKLALDVSERLLKTKAPIVRVKLSTNVLAHTDFALPGGLKYNIETFVERVAIYRNGQLLFNGAAPPINDLDPSEVYPGSDSSKIKFDMDLWRGETIQVIVL